VDTRRRSAGSVQGLRFLNFRGEQRRSDLMESKDSQLVFGIEPLRPTLQLE